MSRLNRAPVLCAHTTCCLIVSLYLFISGCEAVLFVTATQEVVSFESALVVGVSCKSAKRNCFYYGYFMWTPQMDFLKVLFTLCFINLRNLTTVMFSCSPSKFCISRKQASNPWELTFSTQRVAASCFWPSTECSAVRKT